MTRPEEVAQIAAQLHAESPVDYVKAAAAFVVSRVTWTADPPDCERLCSPGRTLATGQGDCDDFALLLLALLLAGGIDAAMVVGKIWQEGRWQGHAWVVGRDDHGAFAVEAVNGTVFDHVRPAGYSAHLELHPEYCALCSAA